MTAIETIKIADWVIAKARKTEIYAEYHSEGFTADVPFDFSEIEEAFSITLTEEDKEDILWELEQRDDVDDIIENKDENGEWIYYEPDFDIYIF